MLKTIIIIIIFTYDGQIVATIKDDIIGFQKNFSSTYEN